MFTLSLLLAQFLGLAENFLMAHRRTSGLPGKQPEALILNRQLRGEPIKAREDVFGLKPPLGHEISLLRQALLDPPKLRFIFFYLPIKLLKRLRPEGRSAPRPGHQRPGTTKRKNACQPPIHHHFCHAASQAIPFAFEDSGPP